MKTVRQFIGKNTAWINQRKATCSCWPVLALGVHDLHLFHKNTTIRFVVQRTCNTMWNAYDHLTMSVEQCTWRQHDAISCLQHVSDMCYKNTESVITILVLKYGKSA